MASMRNAWIGEYRVAELIGAGGMGEVYKAVHAYLGRVIAIKVLSPEMADGAALKRFYSEADIQAGLRHPGVAEYLGFYEYEGRPCILMEYIDGETLSSIVQRRGPLPVDEAVQIVREIAAVAAHFHARGVIHRDLKTSNVKRTPSGQIKVLDFGIAQHQRSERLTRAGAVAGTPATLAPEQVRGETVSQATDVWQLGILFYELLTGQLPFQADTSQEVFARILFSQCPAITQWRPGIPAPVARIVACCLRKEAAKRYNSAAELYKALVQLEREAAPKRYGLFAAGGMAALAVLAGIAMAVHSGHSEPRKPIEVIRESLPAAEMKTVMVDTVDGAAEVYREGARVGTTPYEVRVRPGDTVSLVLRREGFQDLPVQFEPTERRSYTYTLQTQKRDQK